MDDLAESEQKKLADALRAPPSWQTDGLGIKGPQPATSPAPSVDVNRRSDQPVGSITRPFDPDPAPAAESTVTQAPVTVDDNNYGFKMIASGKKDDNDVRFIDGFVNGVLPTGMGNDDFTLTFGGDGYQAWVEVTYDPSTLAITSRTINQGPAIPASTLGDAFLLLGDVSITDGILVPRHAQCGDINIGFVFGDVNGTPALFLLSQLDDPVAVV
jgi:hypothetical protein